MTRLTDFCISRRWLTLSLWIVLTAALIGLAQLRPGPTSDEYTIPDAPSTAAQELLERHDLAADTGAGGQVVFEASNGLAAHASALKAYVETIGSTHPEWELRSADPATGLSGDLR